VVPRRTNDFLNFGFKEIWEAVCFFLPKKIRFLVSQKRLTDPSFIQLLRVQASNSFDHFLTFDLKRMAST
jgi:hypothetical protein